jgi:hypothetical protein
MDPVMIQIMETPLLKNKQSKTTQINQQPTKQANKNGQ